ncbi:DsbA family protein [Martelella soudanensis]|uniref:DsbA family protein n=1 Tax=unclassified Martelella TaxID=2629616 RepID=UPI0015DE267C|nr:MULTISPECIES: hypothetical protein [unclassified Martelella]
MFNRKSAVSTSVLFPAALLGLWPLGAIAENVAQTDIDLPWQTTFVGCSTSAAPFIENQLNLYGARPLMKVGGMQAWAVPQGDGTEKFALTTEDGLTIFGLVVGPQGEDISGALLSTKPNAVSLKTASAPSPSRPPSPKVANEEPAASNPNALEPPGRLTEAVPAEAEPVKAPSSDVVEPSDDAARAASADQADAGKPPKLASVGSQNTPDIPTAQSLDELVQQAHDFSAWFPVGNPRPDAPTFFLLADPTCPHCAWSIDSMKPLIQNGDIDLRIILAPILSETAFNISAAILQSDDVGTVFLRNEYAATSSVGGQKVAAIASDKIDDQTADILRRNVLWMRQNGIKGVPFFIYKTPEGGQFAFGNLTQQALDTALTME